jgi:RHS repeat-associated protein
LSLPRITGCGVFEESLHRRGGVTAVTVPTVRSNTNLADAVTVMSDNTGSTTNLYDAAGRLYGIDYPSGASVRYGFDLLGQITGITNKPSTSGTARITHYAYDAVGNVTNVTDPFNGVTSFEYDCVGRKTKRALPNGVVTTYAYNWRDQLTNIVHKTSGGTTLASAAYERAPFGEPTKIIREGGSNYVVLKYDGALRLTNEQHYINGVNGSNGTVHTSNGYGYDAAGNRVLLVTGGVTYTNAVSAGYRITEVKNGAATAETYSYDSGGRVTSMMRGGATRNFGYNSADQLTAVTNGATWTTYSHDAQGRRTKSADNTGAQRRFLVAGTPGTDLESFHLIADSTNGLKQGYVFVSDDPVLRYDSSGNRVYYLEDAMGSVIGLAPHSSPGTANTTKLFYDGFGKTRQTNGPAPTLPSGTGGDFRFHGAWWESATDLYHMRAREYDQRMGRFMSRDPDEGGFESPESINPYVFAHNNPAINSDPTGEFTMIEIDFAGALQGGIQASRVAAAQQARKMMLRTVGRIARDQFVDYLRSLIPIDSIVELGLDTRKLGDKFQKVTEDFICEAVPLPKDWVWLEPKVVGKSIGFYQPGDVRGNGFGCSDRNTAKRASANTTARPDLIISPRPPVRSDGSTERGFLIAEMKLSGRAFERAYLTRKPKQVTQWAAIKGYAKRNSYSHTAVLVSLYRVNSPIQKQLRKDALEGGAFAMFISIIPDRGGKTR